MLDPKVDAAVRKVLYDPSRIRQLVDLLSSIDVLMNLNPRNFIPTSDPRVHAGAGPTWYVTPSDLYHAAKVKVGPEVIEAADHCDKIADLLLETRDDLAKVDFSARDKQNLHTALTEAAHAMRARAGSWRAPGPIDADRAATSIVAHERASQDAFRAALPYLHEVDLSRMK
jgi:hypothetical protein